MRRLLLAALLSMGAACAAPAAALAHTETASSGSVTAALSYDGAAASGFTNLRLSIRRGAATAYDRPVSATSCGNACLPDGMGRVPSVTVADLDRDGEPEVLLDLYTGGAHCCSLTQVFSWDAAAGFYRPAEHLWGDPGYRLTDIDRDGRPELESADDRFAYRFQSYAFSGLPVQVWHYDHGRFLDATRAFPALVRADARHWLHAFQHYGPRGLGAGYLAAWAADESLLGKRKLVAATLARALARGELRASPGQPAAGARFVRSLTGFLRRTGYLR